MVKSGTKPPSARDARKTQTRRALKDAALRLFAAQGYDATSTEQIAEKAGVSWRTFFRYFPTKESILFEGEGPWFESLTDILCDKPSSLSDVDAICSALVDLAPGLAQSRPRLRLYERCIASSATLRGLRQDYHQRNEQQLAAAIASRRGLAEADEACALLAAVGVLSLRRALDRWLAAPAGLQLSDLIEASFGVLTESFAPPETHRNVRTLNAGGTTLDRGRPRNGSRRGASNQ